LLFLRLFHGGAVHGFRLLLVLVLESVDDSEARVDAELLLLLLGARGRRRREEADEDYK
jgi:hypothetical protein